MSTSRFLKIIGFYLLFLSVMFTLLIAMLVYRGDAMNERVGILLFFIAMVMLGHVLYQANSYLNNRALENEVKYDEDTTTN